MSKNGFRRTGTYVGGGRTGSRIATRFNLRNDGKIDFSFLFISSSYIEYRGRIKVYSMVLILPRLH